jgi:hypothetical protein
MSEDKERTRQFRGKTREDIEFQYTKWQREKAGKIYDVEPAEIVLLSAAETSPKVQYGKLEAVEKFSMLVTYKVVKPPHRGRK